MNVLDYAPVFKQIEINRSVGLRSGHLIAQEVLEAADFFDTIPTARQERHIENGTMLYLDIDGKLKAPKNITPEVKPYCTPLVHWTEELQNPLNPTLSGFTVMFDANNKAYPRMLALYTGDEFTTDNFVGDLETATVATINDDGKLELHANIGAAGLYSGAIFRVQKGTTPAGTEEAGIFTMIAPYVTL